MMLSHNNVRTTAQTQGNSLSQPQALSGSFRDPAGQVFRRDGVLYRQINRDHDSDYRRLMESGLYERLVNEQLLIPHEEVGLELALSEAAAVVIRPQLVDFVSYPWEWCFSQLQDAAILTLRIQQLALEYGMVLKDASAFNVQFLGHQPVFIDTLSFEDYEEGKPWVAYRQFCQHFFAPLALASNCDYRLVKLQRSYIDGIPLDLASRLLPIRSWLRYSLLAHIHLHARAQQRFADAGRSDGPKREVSVSLMGMKGLIDGLLTAVRKLKWQAAPTEWGDYYSDTNYADNSMQEKVRLVEGFLAEVGGSGVALDLGANTGRFSRLGLAAGFSVVAADIDELAVERCYQISREQTENVLPLVQDLSNPTPALGWAHNERLALAQRGPVRVALALALVHHIAISNNVPLSDCAAYFAQLTEHLIIEFVPKSDSQVARLLSTREDIFPDYHKQGFEAAFGKHFELLSDAPVAGSDRHLYLMRRIIPV